MPARMRVYLAVAAAALAAAGATVAVTLATRSTVPTTEGSTLREGVPPLVLELEVRTDPEAVALRRAAQAYDEGSRAEAAETFDRFDSPEARVGSALARWPEGFGALEALSRELPGSALVQLHFGLALYWRREDDRARGAWRLARNREPDSPYAIRATDLLFPNFPRGIPIFVPSFPPPAELERLGPPRQLELLRTRAAGGGVRERLLYGVALQRLGHRISARREFEAAAAAAPGEAEPLVAVAVSRFDKANPSAAFSRLGPLARRFPQSQSVRFHLGVLLLWLGELDEAESNLRRARALGPETPLGMESKRFLDRLETVRTG